MLETWTELPEQQEGPVTVLAQDRQNTSNENI